ncbi:sel1 repeat family protein, partial [Streptomyces sp. SID2563]|nr:sel1 repeat family protein [Streptomyces sp. SID2563]
ADLLEHRSDVGAERWLRAAAEQGHREAAYRLARLLERHATDAAHEVFGRPGLGPRTGAEPAPPRRAAQG